ncbi:MAG: PDZ domain-containing protein [Verrucomicrobiota bacterium]
MINQAILLACVLHGISHESVKDFGRFAETLEIPASQAVQHRQIYFESSSETGVGRMVDWVPSLNLWRDVSLKIPQGTEIGDLDGLDWEESLIFGTFWDGKTGFTRFGQNEKGWRNYGHRGGSLAVQNLLFYSKRQAIHLAKLIEARIKFYSGKFHDRVGLRKAIDENERMGRFLGDQNLDSFKLNLVKPVGGNLVNVDLVIKDGGWIESVSHLGTEEFFHAENKIVPIEDVLALVDLNQIEIEPDSELDVWLERNGRGRLGAYVEPHPVGFVVTEVIAGSAAKTAGILKGDVLVGLDSISLSGLEKGQLRDLFLSRQDGVTIRLMRGSDVIAVENVVPRTQFEEQMNHLFYGGGGQR